MSSGTLYVKDSRTNAQYEIPIRRNAVSALDFKKIKASGVGTDRADQVAGGLRVHDPGLQNTTVVETAISFSDHERNLLLFRGYSLEQLWESDFEDVLHLLVWGSYPTVLQRKDLNHKLTEAMLAVPESVQRTIQSLPSTTTPLPLIIAGLSAYLACRPNMIPTSRDANLYRSNMEVTDHAIIQTVAVYAVVFGLVNSHRKGVPFTPPTRGKSYYENLFTMAGMIDPTTGRPDPPKLSSFRRFAMLNSDHGMALTVFSALTTASSLTDPISCLITAIGSAWGPLHFGATESAQRTLKGIGSPENVPAYIEKVKQGHEKLFGYGHRSYKGIDPRVRPIRSILNDMDLSSNQLLEVAERIEEVCAEDDYFRKRGLYVNGDFYGNFIFAAIGCEPEMIPAAMLAQRIMGIMAHWREYMLTRGKLKKIIMADESGSASETTPLLASQLAEPYSVFTATQKHLIILTAALASSFSPLSANIYYPALNSIAADLHVSSSQINLTITTYMLCQGVAPAFMGSFADQAGRRPAYILCFVIYIVGNIALALQHSYPALLILRAIQSCGSSGTVALASAVAADVITSAERGTYMGITSLGTILAPSVGPLLGGLLSQYLGWQAIFWFLAITSDSPSPVKQKEVSLPDPLSTLRLLFHRPTGLVLLANGLLFASYYAVTAGIPSQFKEIYQLNDLAIGLVFIPAGIGSLLSTTFNGIVLDWNYRRLQGGYGPGTRHKPSFPIEQARLQICLPLIILSATAILGYALLMSLVTHPPLSYALSLIFTISFAITAAYNIMNILIVDLYYATPATAMAANNLVRCFLGAGATGLVHPAIVRWGNGRIMILLLLIIGIATARIDPLLPTYQQILHLRYPLTPWVQPGDTLLMSDTHPLPTLSTLGLIPTETYLLLFLDLDVIYSHNSTVILHWYQPDLIFSNATPPTTDTHTQTATPVPPPPLNNLNQEPILTPHPSSPPTHTASYIPPQPPPHSHHRYVYLLYQQPPTYIFPTCFDYIFPPTAHARAGFDVRQFTAVAGLGGPVAGNYFFVLFDGGSSSGGMGMETGTGTGTGTMTMTMTGGTGDGKGRGTPTTTIEYMSPSHQINGILFPL
ncbi:putative citrate synthase [Aspergillus ibericus CBS 121593]|uniref:Citrate synthase n=1 Tax=Aspergillus ibericus CBS 121593 TaxID=1448316 RepID=A0A395HAX8_9EURO|nr:citrate synthase [Aspergillus ibericus CBS 121593]RAL04653.1 citrate synthase [Aspergillus ibericus CBS 121593]